MPHATNGNRQLVARRTTELEPVSPSGDGQSWAPSSAMETGVTEPGVMETGLHEASDFDDLYDRVLSRLRRDLIVERERRGDLAGAYFRRG